MGRYLKATRIDIFNKIIGSIAISGMYYEMGFFYESLINLSSCLRTSLIVYPVSYERSS